MTRGIGLRATLLLLACVFGLAVAPGCGLVVQRVPMETVALEDEIVLPTIRCADTYLVRAEINGRGPFVLMIDTGASGSLLTPEAAARLEEWTSATWFPMVGATGKRVDARTKVRIESLRVGGFEVRGLDAVVMGLGGFDAALGGELDGILGYPAFRDVLLTFDYPAGEVRVGPGSLGEGPHTEDLHHRYAPVITLDVQGTRKQVVIDTGSSGSLSMPSSEGIEFVEAPRVVGSVLALGGVDLRTEGRLAGSLELGGHTLREPIVDSSKVLPLMGSDVLRFFTLRIDQKNRLAEFTREAGDPIVFPSTFGIGVGGFPEHGGLRITEVFEGLPAERAGIRPGDLIETIDGHLVTDLFCAEHALYTQPGLATLGILRDGERLLLPTEIVVLVP